MQHKQFWCLENTKLSVKRGRGGRVQPRDSDQARFTLATGLPEANVTGLEWSQVDQDRRIAWIHPDQSKSRRPIPVPLNADAVLVLQSELGSHPSRVFTFKGQPVTKANNHAW